MRLKSLTGQILYPDPRPRSRTGGGGISKNRQQLFGYTTWRVAMFSIPHPVRRHTSDAICSAGGGL